VADGQAPRRSSFQVDIVHPHGELADNAQLFPGIHHFGVDGIGQQTEQPLAVRHLTQDDLLGRRQLLHPEPHLAGTLDHPQACLGDTAGDIDLWFFAHSPSLSNVPAQEFPPC
jgi:hypothetical protein